MTQEKLLDRIAKLQAMAVGAQQVGNMAESEAFAAKVQELLNRHKLTMTEVELREQDTKDPMGKSSVDPTGEIKRRRVLWQERLASACARAYFCKIFVYRGLDRVCFVGRETDRQVAIWVFTNLVRQAEELADKAYTKFFYECKAKGEVERARGFRASFLDSFVATIAVRFAKEREHLKASDKMALVKLDKAMDETLAYYSTLNLSKGTSLQGNTGFNSHGWAHGAKAGNGANLKGNAINSSGAAAKQLRA